MSTRASPAPPATPVLAAQGSQLLLEFVIETPEDDAAPLLVIQRRRPTALPCR
ncbi:hypothetical protein ACSZOJ_12645 [Aeromonas dhakensis]